MALFLAARTWTDMRILTSLSSDYFTRFRARGKSDNRFRHFLLSMHFSTFEARTISWEQRISRVDLHPFGSQVPKVRKCPPTAITFGLAACLITPSGHVSRAPFARRIWTSVLSALIALSCYQRDISLLETTIITFKGSIRRFQKYGVNFFISVYCLTTWDKMINLSSP